MLVVNLKELVMILVAFLLIDKAWIVFGFWMSLAKTDSVCAHYFTQLYHAFFFEISDYDKYAQCWI